MNKKLIINNSEIEYDLLEKSGRSIKFKVGDIVYQYCMIKNDRGQAVIKHRSNAGSFFKKVLVRKDKFQVEGLQATVLRPVRNQNGVKADSDLGHMCSPMPGKILQVLVSVGDLVNIGDPLIIMEAMKMEHTIKSNQAGKVLEVHFSEGEQVDGAVDLIDIESLE